MKEVSLVNKKILDRESLVNQSAEWKKQGKRIVFTNGCFDILHRGHLQILTDSAAAGDILVVGLNTDASVRKLKGENRPVNEESFRALMMASIQIVDAVTLFEEDTPLQLIRVLEPDVIVKGGDYTIDQIVGGEDVLRRGGEIKIVPIVKGYSTSALIEAIQKL
jgi:D-glycero-beta-D-manno-heptose 1-phosphate adenylyltransferase